MTVRELMEHLSALDLEVLSQIFDDVVAAVEAAEPIDTCEVVVVSYTPGATYERVCRHDPPNPNEASREVVLLGA